MLRRELIALSASLTSASLFGCDGRSPDSGSARGGMPPRSGPREGPPQKLESSWRELDFEASNDYPDPERATVLIKGGDVPLLIALHGAGEAARGMAKGARGWRDDYDLDRCEARLRNPPLMAGDFLGFVKPERLAALNGSLSERAFAGLCVACPYTPPIRALDAARAFAQFLGKQLVPRVRKEAGLTESGKVGIDGVSMGGRLALLIGLSYPEQFDSVAALQPAIAVEEAQMFSELAARAMAKKKLPLRLVSSSGDGFLEAVLALSEQLRKGGVGHQLLITPGPHDYAWNRGPGSIEMLLWHDRVLRGHPGV